MAAEQTGFQITYASVESPDGGDPTATAERILRDQARAADEAAKAAKVGA